MAGRSEQRGSKDSSGGKPLSDMDPEGMDSEIDGDDLDSGDAGSQSTARPEHNRRESDKDRVPPSGDRER